MPMLQARIFSAYHIVFLFLFFLFLTSQWFDPNEFMILLSINWVCAFSGFRVCFVLILMNIYQFVVSIDMTSCLLTSYEQITKFLPIESKSEPLVLFQMWWFVFILGMSFNVFREMTFWRRCHVVFIALNWIDWQLIWLMRPELQFYPGCSNSFSNPL